MLQHLRIKNLAVVDDLAWEPGPGFNVLTGETGAGKSIVIDALMLLLGDRADKRLIREGEAECAVEGVLGGNAELRALLEEGGAEAGQGDELILRRTLPAERAGRQFCNGSPVTVQVLRALGEALVDFHGPHDHQSLLSNEAQRTVLDNAAGLTEEAEACRELHRAWRGACARLEELRRAGQEDASQRLDYLEHQIREIEGAELRPGEAGEVEAAYHAASNSQEILQVAAEAGAVLAGEETGALARLAEARRRLEQWERVDPGARELREALEGAVAQLQDLERAVATRAERVDLDAEALARLEERLNLIRGLERRHGGSVEAVLGRLEQYRVEREELAGRAERTAALESETAARRQRLEAAARALGKKRRGHAPKLARAITAELHGLGFRKAVFEIRIEEEAEPGPGGMDRVEFLFAPNEGEGLKPLRAVASSGEMARVMLAIKTVVAEWDRVPVLIFDEVDANVGGETAVQVGRRLRGLGRKHQVICITHLPQVAAAGEHHVRVVKETSGGRTRVRLERLEGAERRRELARMLGGENAASLRLAEELLRAVPGVSAQDGVRK